MSMYLYIKTICLNIIYFFLYIIFLALIPKNHINRKEQMFTEMLLHNSIITLYITFIVIIIYVYIVFLVIYYIFIIVDIDRKKQIT